MRLIDLDELEKFPIRENHYDKKNGNVHFICGIETIIEYAESLPIYTLDKVIERLEPLEKYNNDRENCKFAEGYGCAIDEAIEIVKGGC